MRSLYTGLLLCCCTTSMFAATDSTQTLGLDDVIVKILHDSPRLKAADYTAKSAAARIRSAGLSAPIEATVELENFAGSGIYQGSDQLETTLSFAKVLELGNKPALRAGVATNQADIANQQQYSLQLDLIKEATINYAKLAAEHERHRIATEAVNIAEEILSVAKRRVTTGRTAKTELRLARIGLKRTELLLSGSMRDLQTASLNLTSLWGESNTEIVNTRAQLFNITALATYAELKNKIHNNPDLLRLQSQQKLAKAQLQLARAKSSPNVQLNAGVRHFNDENDAALLFSVNIPFGSAGRAKANIDATYMQTLREPYLYQDQLNHVQSLLFQFYQRAEYAVETFTILNSFVIPEAKLLLNDYQHGYGLGRYSFLDLTRATDILRQARLEAVDAAEQYHIQRAEIERLTARRNQEIIQ